jgi:hypothetical protein
LVGIRRLRDGNAVIAKLRVSRNRPRAEAIFPYLHLRLSDAVRFVQAAARNLDAKVGARHFFPSELLQYVIWEREQALRRRRRMADDPERSWVNEEPAGPCSTFTPPEEHARSRRRHFVGADG